MMVETAASRYRTIVNSGGGGGGGGVRAGAFSDFSDITPVSPPLIPFLSSILP